MKQRDELDRMLDAWLDDPYTAPTPRILRRVLERTGRTRQRRAWTSLERWLPMAVITRPAAAAPSLRIAWILLIALLGVAIATGSALIGSQLLRAPVAIPEGGSAVFAFGSYEGDESSPQLVGDIFTIRADGTDLRQLTSGAGIESNPAWSPDGTRIAYRLWQDSKDSVMVMDAGGGSVTTLATSGTTTQYCTAGWTLTWSPDGGSLLFPASSGCQGGELMVVATDGSAPATNLLAPGMSSQHGTWSPDGKRIAFLGSEAAGDVGLYVADVGTGGALSGGLQGTRIGSDLGSDLADPSGRPQWSPDGSELVAAGPQGVFVIKADGSGQRLVVENASKPAWSPGGDRLAFLRQVDPSEYWNGRPCTTRTWVIDADGTNERELEELGDGCAFGPAWSPDGTRLASIVIASAPDDPERRVRPGAIPSQEWWHLGFVTLDGSSPLAMTGDVSSGSWQPVAAPLPPAPSFAAVLPAP